jgi:hypothetical protein
LTLFEFFDAFCDPTVFGVRPDFAVPDARYDFVGAAVFGVGDGADILLFCVDDRFLAGEMQALDVRVGTVDVDTQDAGFFLTHACNSLVAVEGRSIDQANREIFWH